MMDKFTEEFIKRFETAKTMQELDAIAKDIKDFRDLMATYYVSNKLRLSQQQNFPQDGLNKKGIQWNFLIGECSKLEAKMGIARYKQELNNFGYQSEMDIKDIKELKKFIEVLEETFNLMEAK